MNKYAKLVDGQLEYPILDKVVLEPIFEEIKFFDDDGNKIIEQRFKNNNWLKILKTEGELREEVFKELIEAARPDDGRVYRLSYIENENTILAVWEEIMPDPTSEPTYAELRAVAYPDMTEQLDKLYHDIDGGLFGDAAKTSAFYLARKEVKDTYPKVAQCNEPPADESAPSE